MAELTSKALTTLAHVRQELNISADDTDDDNYLIDKINSVSIDIENFCNRILLQQEHVEYYKGRNKPYLYLKNAPIVGDPVIVYNDETYDSSNYTVYSDDTSVKIENTSLWESSEIKVGISDALNKKVLNIKVTYTAGFLLPDSESSNLPLPIKEACTKQVVYEYNNRGVARGVHSEKLITGSVTYDNVNPQTRLLQSVEAALYPYKKR